MSISRSRTVCMGLGQNRLQCVFIVYPEPKTIFTDSVLNKKGSKLPDQALQAVLLVTKMDNYLLVLLRR